MLATPVKAFGGSDGAVIIAKVPTRLADAWFGAEELLDANGWPGVLDGGVTEIRVFVDDGGFPFKVSYSGADMELRSEVSAYMKDNLAVSQLTAYYAPARLERVNRASR
jgi:hypothetical protein